MIDIESLYGMVGGNPSNNMRILLSKLTPSGIVPEVDKYYVFIYRAKTPNIQYDRHPFIVCTGVYKWGFTGLNYHIGPRRYTWAEVVSNIYNIPESQVETMKSFPIAKIVSN